MQENERNHGQDTSAASGGTRSCREQHRTSTHGSGMLKLLTNDGTRHVLVMLIPDDDEITVITFS